jgi:hypothetical protein
VYSSVNHRSRVKAMAKYTGSLIPPSDCAAGSVSDDGTLPMVVVPVIPGQAR